MNKKYIWTVQGPALILGGSGDIGAEIVRAAAAQGVKDIAFTYGRNKSAAEALAAELEGLGVTCHYASVDLLDEAAFKQFLDDAVAKFGEEIVIAVNAVGISPDTAFQEQTLELLRTVFDTNVHGAFLSLRAVANRMREKGVSGAIVDITSTNGINSHSAFSAPYDASKAAQAHMMRILAEEYAPHIRINSVAPGWINTKMNATVPPEDMKKEIGKIWLKRQADPSEIASVVLFLCSSGASYIYGQNIMVDGGYR